MKIAAAMLATVALAACTDPEPVRGDLATFDGEWGWNSHCTGVAVGGRCDLPWGRTDFPQAAIASAVVTLSGLDGTVLATHRGDVLDGCLSVPAGLDGDLAHDAYDLCPVDGATPREIRGDIVWGRGTVGECHCDTTLRLQP